MSGHRNSRWFALFLSLTVALMAGIAFGATSAFASPANQVLSPTSLNFPNQSIGGASDPQTVTVKNIGSDPLAIIDVALANGPRFGFAITNDMCSGQVLNLNQTCTFGVTFTPPDVGLSNDIVEVNSNLQLGQRFLNVSGTGVSSKRHHSGIKRTTACRNLEAQNPAEFKTLFGTNNSGANAFGKCVSTQQGTTH